MSEVKVNKVSPRTGTDVTLGGKLDTNDNNIITSSNRDLNLYPNGTGAVEIGGNTNPGTIILNCESNSHGVKLQSPAHSSAQSYTMKLPATNITAGKFLKVDSITGSGATAVGQLSFADAGGNMTPAFYAELSATQNTTDSSATKIQFNTEVYDSGSVYDNSSNYRFTPGVAGKYFIFSGLTVYGSVAFTIGQSYYYLYKNGSAFASEQHYEFQSEFHGSASFHMGRVLVLDDDDYIEMYLNADVSSGNPAVVGGTGTNNCTYFGAYKIIE